MKSEPIRNLLEAGSGCAGSFSLSGRPCEADRRRPGLTRQQNRAAALDRAYFEVELFAQVAEQAPELLVGPCRLLHDLVRASDRYHFYRPATVGEIEDGLAPDPLCYFDLDALHADWQSLKERVWLVS